jgi:uncharacterized MnhB-related membrane protein
MNTFYKLLEVICWLGLLLCLLGMWRPWLLLWWLDKQNRLRVLIYYGIPSLLATVLYLLLAAIR